MNISIEDQSSLLVDMLASLLISSINLNEKQVSQIEKMNTKINEFVSQFATHSQLSDVEFASYLNHDALSPLTVVMGYAELFRTIQNTCLTEYQFSMIETICELVRQLTDNLRKLRDETVAKLKALTS